jgi:hypothetical protein
MLLPMPKIIFKMVSLRLEDIVIFVFGFPATPARSHHLDNRVMVEPMTRDKGVAIEHLPILLTCNHQLTPVDE